VINAKRDYEPSRSNATSKPSAAASRRPVLRRKALGSYTFKSAVLKLPHLNQVVHHHAHNKTAKPGKEELYRDEEEEEEEEEELEASRRHMQRSGVQHAVKECHRAFHAPPSGEKHHHHQKRKEKDGKKVKEREYEYEGQYDRDGQHIQQGHGRQQQEVSASRQRTNEDTTMAYDNAVHGVMTDMSRQACKDALGDEKAKKSHKPVSQPPGALPIDQANSGVAAWRLFEAYPRRASAAYSDALTHGSYRVQYERA